MAEQDGAGGRPFTAPSPSGFTSLSDVDSTVLAYAQWLSELQQHANQAKYHQKAELEVLRESVSAQNAELNDFKRHCMGSIQQIQQQVSDLKLTMADLQRSVSEMKIQVTTTKSSVTEVKSNLTELQAERDLGLGGDPFSEAGSPAARSPVGVGAVRGSPSSAARSSAGLEISKLYRIIREVQEMTLAKFGEVDEAMKILHGHSGALQKDLQGSHADWKKSQELLSHAVAALSQDLGDFRQNVSSTSQKSQTEILQLQEDRHVDAERLSRMDLQVTALHQNVQANTNDLILLRGERGERGERAVSPQRRVPVPTPGQRLQGQSHSHLLDLLDQQAQIRAGVKRT